MKATPPYRTKAFNARPVEKMRWPKLENTVLLPLEIIFIKVIKVSIKIVWRGTFYYNIILLISYCTTTIFRYINKCIMRFQSKYLVPMVALCYLLRQFTFCNKLIMYHCGITMFNSQIVNPLSKSFATLYEYHMHYAAHIGLAVSPVALCLQLKEGVKGRS